MNKFALPLIIVAVVGVMLGLFFLGNQQSASQQNAAIAGVKDFGKPEQGHTPESVSFAENPPVGGKHSPQWATCDGRVYTQKLRNENAVHSLEHGAVWITYKPGLEEAQLQALADKVEGTPYTLMSPNPEQSSPITLSAWGKQLSLENASDERIEQFLEKYRQGTQTPEPGATCSGGVGA